MYKTIVLVLVVLTFGQVPAGLVERAFNRDTTTEDKTSSSRITSGWEAYPGQFPYVASLRLFYLAGGVGNCVGSVVHHNWVLTTATCLVRPFAVVVRSGVTDLTTTPEYIVETREWWMHPSFDVNILGSFQSNNICILKLQQIITYSKLVQPIGIQPSADAFADYADEVVIASGWGRLWSGDYPEVLNWVYLRAISNQDCRRQYGASVISDTQICTRGYNETSQSVCTEDNGGPLVHVGRDREPVLVGLAVHLVCSSGSPAVFTRPGPFHGWLNEITGLDFEKLNEEDTTETPEPPTTIEVTTPLTTTPKPSTTEVTESSTSEAPESMTTEILEPLTTETPEPLTTEPPEPSITEAPELDSKESDEDSDGSESNEDPESFELLNKLRVKVNVKVKVNNNIKKKVKVK